MLENIKKLDTMYQPCINLFYDAVFLDTDSG
jgi:hypothetical protein